MPTIAEQLQARKLFAIEQRDKRVEEQKRIAKRTEITSHLASSPIEDGIATLGYPELFDGTRYKELVGKICYSILKENHVGMKRKNVNYYRPDIEFPLEDMAHDVLVEVMSMPSEVRSRYHSLAHALSCVAWTHTRHFLRHYARCGRSLSDIEITPTDHANAESWETMKARLLREGYTIPETGTEQPQDEQNEDEASHTSSDIEEGHTEARRVAKMFSRLTLRKNS